MVSPAYVYLPSLREIDALELEEHLPQGTVQARRSLTHTHAGQHGDFGMITVVVTLGGLAALRALSVWIAKKVSRETTTTELSVTQEPDGKLVVSFHQSVERSTTQPTNAETAKSIEAQLTKLLRGLLDE